MKLTKEKVSWLRSQIGTATKLREALWRKYGVLVTIQTIRNILSNRVWRDPSYNPSNRILKGEKCPWAKLNWDIVNFMRNAYLNKTKKLKELQQLLIDELGITVNIKTIHAIVRNKKWYDSNYLRAEGGVNLFI